MKDNKMKPLTTIAFVLVLALLPTLAHSHDTWVETSGLSVRSGEYVYIDLRLGNHGNGHRDFKLASKITLAPCQLSVITPSGDSEDLKSKLIDTGSAEKEGYWTTRYVAKQPGVYEVLHTLDTLHGKTRAIKSSKTYLVALDANAPAKFTGQENIKPHGLGLEMLLETPVAQLAAGQPIRVRLLRSDKPLSDTVVSFIPRGAVLSEGFDASFERRTDSEGRVEFVPLEGNLVLAVAHHVAEDERGEGYDKTHYGATLVLPVPQQPLGK